VIADSKAHEQPESAFAGRYPLLLMVPDYGPDKVEGRDLFALSFSEDQLTLLPKWEIDHGTHIGMLIIDAIGNCWRVLNIEDLGAVGDTFWTRLAGRQRRVRYDVVQEAPLSFPDLKKRAAASFEAEESLWWFRQARSAAPGRPLKQPEEVKSDFLERIQLTNSVLELIAVMYFTPME
jgi:hypothetical protein